MARGRKPKNPQLEFLKNPPPHIVERAASPAGKRRLAESKKAIKKRINQYRELRKHRISSERFVCHMVR